MKKLYKVHIGKPTGGDRYITFSYGDEKKIKSEYFVVASTFNEAGKVVMAFVDRLIAEEKSHVRVTEFGLENLDQEYNVCKIELISNELIMAGMDNNPTP